MTPFIRQDPPLEYTLAEWRYEDVSIVIRRQIGSLLVQVWVRGESTPLVLAPGWAVLTHEVALDVAQELARVVGPLVLTASLPASGERTLHLFAMREYGDVYDGSQVKLYYRSDPRGENPWLAEIEKLEEELETGIRRHTFKLNLDNEPLAHTLYGEPVRVKP